jgi:hypothetical protein
MSIENEGEKAPRPQLQGFKDKKNERDEQRRDEMRPDISA